jgi:hypothetical protein
MNIRSWTIGALAAATVLLAACAATSPLPSGESRCEHVADYRALMPLATFEHDWGYAALMSTRANASCSTPETTATFLRRTQQLKALTYRSSTSWLCLIATVTTWAAWHTCLA